MYPVIIQEFLARLREMQQFCMTQMLDPLVIDTDMGDVAALAKLAAIRERHNTLLLAEKLLVDLLGKELDFKPKDKENVADTTAERGDGSPIY
jgi:hypothetical protein